MHGGIEKPGEELPPVMGQAVSFQSLLNCKQFVMNLFLIDRFRVFLVIGCLRPVHTMGAVFFLE